jgi:hypothetical protein
VQQPGVNAAPTLVRRRLMATSTTLVLLSKFMSQTSPAIAVLDRISPWRRASTASRENSFAVSSMRVVPRQALRAIRSICRLAIFSSVGSWLRPLRRSACSRASGSRNENGLTR